MRENGESSEPMMKATDVCKAASIKLGCRTKWLRVSETQDGKDKFAIMQLDGAASAGPGFHLAFAAPSREAVDAFHEASIRQGASDNGAPGLRAHYGPDYYAAFIIDLDGHRIEAVHRAPVRTGA